MMNCVCLLAQDIKTENKKSFKHELPKFSGSLAWQTGLTQTWGGPLRRDPFWTMLQVQAQVQYKGIQLPFSISLSPYDYQFYQPFNQFGISPHKGAWTVHLGYRSLMFSEYTQSGGQFLGGGLEFKPHQGRGLQTTWCYGRFSQALTGNGLNNLMSSGAIAYERWGYGTKTDFLYANGQIGIQLFHSYDKAQSIPSLLADSAQVKPMDNLVGALTLEQTLFAHIKIKALYALTALNRDILAPENKGEFAWMPPFFVPTTSLRTSKAWLLDASIPFKKQKISLTYRRTDPDYQSLTAQFLNNDLEDILIGYTTQVSSKLFFQLSGGLQRNNLHAQLIESRIRYLGVFSCQWMPSTLFQIQTQVSNYLQTSRTDYRPTDPRYAQYIRNPDSLRFNQQTLQANGSWVLKFKNNKQISIQGNHSLNKAGDAIGQGSIFLSSQLGTKIKLSPTFLCFPSVWYQSTQMPKVQTQGLGPSLSCTKTFKKPLECTAQIQCLINSGNQNSQRIQGRAQGKYTFKCKHVFQADVIFMQPSSSAGLYEECRFQTSYGYSF